MKNKKRILVAAVVIAVVLSVSSLTAYALTAGTEQKKPLETEEQTASLVMTVAGDCC